VLPLLAQSPAAFIAVALAVGLAVGSFLNVVVYRLPIMLERQWQREGATGLTTGVTISVAAGAAAADTPFNLLVPRSVCPACRAPIAAIHNVPLLSYLALRGRCAHCQARISLALSGGRTAQRCGHGGGGLAARIRWPAAAAAGHLVPDRAHLHRSGHAAAAGLADAAAAVARIAGKPTGWTTPEAASRAIR